jgi:hypothetical protein
MFRFLTFGILVAVVFGFLGVLSIQAQNQAPLVVPPTAQIPEITEAQPEVAEKIRQALNSETQVEEAGNPQTGDMVLDDVLGIIRKRGSVLDGSSLDQPSSESQSTVTSNPSRRAYAAEQLLKSARLLERIDSLDASEQASRVDLIRKIRAEAAKLLSE